MSWVAVGVGAAGLVGSIGGAAISSSASKSAAGTQADAANKAGQLSEGQYYTTRNDLAPYRTAGNLALLQLQKGLGLTDAPGSGPDRSRGNFNESAYLAANPDAQEWVTNQQLQGLGGTAYDHYIADGARRNDPSYFYNTDPNAAAPAGTAPTSTSTDSSGGVGYGSLLRNFTMADFQADPGTAFVQSQGEKAINRGALAAGRYNSGATLKALDTFNTGLADQTYGEAYNRFNQNQTKQFNELSGVAGTGQTATNTTGTLGANAAGAAGNALMSAGASTAAGAVGSANAFTGGISSGLNYWQGQQLINALRPRTNAISSSYNPYDPYSVNSNSNGWT